MTDTEKVEWLATEVMGWTHDPGYNRYDGSHSGEGWTDEHGNLVLNWEPLRDWNHTMQIVEKAVMDGHRFECDLTSTQLEICEAAYLAYQSLR